jgi:LuxR family maltose regulon positive regulatory protein
MLRVKCRRPVRPSHYVQRDRLLALLDEAASGALTVVAAPAGSGKTTLVADWQSRSRSRSVWLSLDERDRGGVAFWTSVLGALSEQMPGVGVDAIDAARRRAPLHEVVSDLLDDLVDQAAEPMVFVIDDLHRVDDDEALAVSLALFVAHLPSWLHVVLLSRREPRLPLDRLRGRGLLSEIYFAELGFTNAEASELLRVLAPSMEQESLVNATAQADGWAAGLQLAALAARSAIAHPEDPSHGVRVEILANDYVWHEVLAAEAEELVDVLVDLSVVDRLPPGLARALSGRADADELLRRAEERGLFVSRREAGDWVEIHSVVRSALTAQLAQRSPERLAEQHRRAAEWLQAAGDVSPALDQWLLAGHPREALRLLAAQMTSLYDSGRESVITATIASIPPEVAFSDLDTMLEFTWCHLLVSRSRFAELAAQVSWVADQSTDVDPTTRARIAILQSIAALTTGEFHRSGVLAREAMEQLGDEWWRDVLGRFGWNLVAREVALSEAWDESRTVVREAQLAVSRDPNRRLAFEGSRALGEALAGRPLSALRSVAGVKRSADVSEHVIVRSELALAEAIAHRELGDRDHAVAAFTMLAEAGAEPMSYVQARAMCELVEVCLDGGAVGDALRWYDRATAFAEDEFTGVAGAIWLGRTGTLLALATGDVELAERRAEATPDPFWRAIGRARVDLARGDAEAAAASLETVLPDNPREEVVLELLRARATIDRDESLKHVYTAVDGAAAVGMLQTVASEGPDTIEQVERAALRAPEEWLHRLRRARSVVPAPERRSTDASETLTDRERDVLRFLPSRLTLPEIANELYVSVNTLKFHLKVIYRKLGVSSRGQAAEVARRMSSSG